jgi:hypothetical protein
LNKGCNNWSEVSKEYIIHLYAEIGKLSVGKRLSQLLSILFKFPHSEAIRNTTAHGFRSIFLRNVFLLWPSQEHWFPFGNGILEAPKELLSLI